MFGIVRPAYLSTWCRIRALVCGAHGPGVETATSSARWDVLRFSTLHFTWWKDVGWRCHEENTPHRRWVRVESVRKESPGVAVRVWREGSFFSVEGRTRKKDEGAVRMAERAIRSWHGWDVGCLLCTRASSYVRVRSFPIARPRLSHRVPLRSGSIRSSLSM